MSSPDFLTRILKSNNFIQILQICPAPNPLPITYGKKVVVYVRNPGFARGFWFPCAVFWSALNYKWHSTHRQKVINKSLEERLVWEKETWSLLWASVFGFAVLCLNVLLSSMSQSSPSARITVIRLRPKTAHPRPTKSGRMGLTKYCDAFVGKFRVG